MSGIRPRRRGAGARLSPGRPPARQPPIVWEVEGELDLIGGMAMRDATTVLPECGRLLYVDLSRVSFLDCSGIGALIDLTRRCRERGVDVVVIGVGARDLRIMATTGADRHLDVAPGWRFAEG